MSRPVPDGTPPLFFFNVRVRSVFWSHAIRSPDWAALSRAGGGQRKGRHLGSSLSLLNGSCLTNLEKTRESTVKPNICVSGAEPEAASEGARAGKGRRRPGHPAPGPPLSGHWGEGGCYSSRCHHSCCGCSCSDQAQALPSTFASHLTSRGRAEIVTITRGNCSGRQPHCGAPLAPCSASLPLSPEMRRGPFAQRAVAPHSSWASLGAAAALCEPIRASPAETRWPCDAVAMPLPLEETKTTRLTSNQGQEERRRHRETPRSWVLLPWALVWLHRPVKAPCSFWRL